MSDDVEFCQRCWDKAVDAAVRSGLSPTDLYREVCRQPRSHCHGLPVSEGGL